MNPQTYRQVARFYDEQATAYDARYSDPISQWENARVQKALQRLCPNMKALSVLDLGCGTGLFLDLGFEPAFYLGVDCSQRMVDIARYKHPQRDFEMQDMLSLPFDYQASQFDLVVSLFGSISVAQANSLDWLLGLLAPGGRFFVMLYADDRGDNYGHRRDRGFPEMQPVPVRFWSAKGVIEELRDCTLSLDVVGLNAILSDGARPSFVHRALNRLCEAMAPSRAALLMVSGQKHYYYGKIPVHVGATGTARLYIGDK